MTKEKNTLGLVALILSIISMTCNILCIVGMANELVAWMIILVALVSFPMSIVACTKKNAKKAAAVTGLVVSIISIITFIVLLVIVLSLSFDLIEAMIGSGYFY